MEASAIINRFLDGSGRLVQLPGKQKTRLLVLGYLAGKFEPGVIYTELQVNGICSRWHTFDDFFLLRRQLVDYGFLGRERDGSRYWRIVPEEQPDAPDKLRMTNVESAGN